MSADEACSSDEDDADAGGAVAGLIDDASQPDPGSAARCAARMHSQTHSAGVIIF